MHESGLIEDLIRKVESVVRDNDGLRAVRIEVTVGALAGIEADHLREHFQIASTGTLAEGAELAIASAEDDLSGEVLLHAVEIE